MREESYRRTEARSRRMLAAPEHEYTKPAGTRRRVDTPGELQPGRRTADTSDGPTSARASHTAVRLVARRMANCRQSKDVSLEVAAGGARWGVGESGCGKSTLTRAMLRLARHERRDRVVRPPSRICQSGTARHGAGMQIVFQDPFASLDPTMSVAESSPSRCVRTSARHAAAERSAKVVTSWRAFGLGAEYAASAVADFPAASVSVWRSHAPWCSSPGCSCATRRSAR
jgi:ABC-type glutathione transport system ATPase component